MTDTMHPNVYDSDVCRICNSPFSGEYVFKEMNFGYRDQFRYEECSYCGCIQIKSLPTNIEKYYPPHYYSFTTECAKLKRQPLFKRLFKDFRIKKKYRQGKNQDVLNYLKPIKVLPSQRILDVGCGKGSYLCSLFNIGFEKVTGVDKFIPTEIDHKFGVKVYKKDLMDLSPNRYHIIMMHHVLEHMDQQINELKSCHRLLKHNGYLIVRIPIINKAWEIFKENWVQLDAPRHFFIHTLKSFKLLAEKTGFKIEKTVFDSTGFQFLGSTLYQKDISLVSDDNNPFSFRDYFTDDEIKEYDAEAERLNSRSEGDQAIFYMTIKKDS